MADRSPRLLFLIPVMLAAGCTTSKFDDASQCVVSPPAQPVACTMQYDPVCGCDGKTYSNACSARAGGVPGSTPGACGRERND